MRSRMARLLAPLLLVLALRADGAVLYGTNRAFTNTHRPSARNHTICVDVNFAAFTAGQAVVFFRDAGATGNVEVLETQTATAVVTLDTTGATVAVATFTAGTWRFVCWSVNGIGLNNIQVYTSPVNGGTLINTVGTDAAIPTAYDTAFVGKDSSADTFTGSLRCYRQWSTVLTAAQIANEQYRCFPQTTTNLDIYMPLYTPTNAVVDYSGNNFNMTVGTNAVTQATTDPPFLR